jgi:ubiquinone biosynthesis protein
LRLPKAASSRWKQESSVGLLTYIGRKFTSFRRYNQIISVLLKYGFEELVAYMDERKRFTLLKKLIPKKTYDEALQLTKWQKIRLVCEELGPTFVKFGQLLSSRTDLLPAELITELEKLQDGVPPVPGKTAQATVEAELKKPVSELFASFEEEAFASASMAQVHKAQLKTGEKVVVKIQRPGIEELIREDIKVMRYMAEVFSSRIPSLRSFDPLGLVRNFEDSISKELDFVHESINIQRFHNQFAKDETDGGYIHSPVSYPALTTSRVLTLEYIDGIKISDTARLLQAGYDPVLIGDRLAYSFLKQVFHYGFFHADPHPGNLLILPGNVICYLDYGMMGSIFRKDLEALSSLFLSVRSKDVKKIIRALQQLSDTTIIRDYRELENDINELVQTYTYTSNSSEISTLLLNIKDIIVKHNLKTPTHFFLLIRALVTAEGVIRKLNPNVDLEKMMKPFLVQLVTKRYNPILFAKRVASSLHEMGMYMEEFPRDLKNAMRRINAGEMKVELRHKGIDPLVHTLNRVTRQLVAAVLVGALVIGGTQMIIHNIHPLWGETSALGVCGFILAGWISFIMLRDLRKGDHDNWAGWRDQ